MVRDNTQYKIRFNLINTKFHSFAKFTDDELVTGRDGESRMISAQVPGGRRHGRHGSIRIPIH